MYIVMSLIEHRDIQIDAMPNPVKATMRMSWADGMQGVVPVFKTKMEAIKYANGRYEILQIAKVDPQYDQPH